MKKLKNLSDININCLEGRYLIAALSKLTNESQRDKEPDEVLEQCGILQLEIYKEAFEIPDTGVCERPTFQSALQSLINQYSMESGSNTPDFVLSEYLNRCLASFNEATKSREKFYGTELKIA